MPEFIGTAKVRHTSGFYERQVIEEYIETLVIEVETSDEADELFGLHYEAKNHESDYHDYKLIDLQISQRMDANEIRQRHARVMAYWDEHYAEENGGRKDD